MRVLFIDIDSLRADHLGCYGYARATSPNIDRIAAAGVRFERCYASDVPCLPSRSAWATGRFGTRNGVVGHGGTAAEPFVEGEDRGFSSRIGRQSPWALLRKAGLYTASISSFAERHSAFHFLAGFQEVLTTGKRGLENADEVVALALDWLARHGQRDNWFLHVQLWDPHTPYRVPAAFGDPFASAPLPPWPSEVERAAHFRAAGPHSAQEAVGFSPEYPWGDYPRQPRQIDSPAALRALFDGYDNGVAYADQQLARLLDQLNALGVREQTAIVLSADHGEALGELNVYGDHHAADEATAHVPMIMQWPGIAPRSERALCYQLDLFATLVELAGGAVPDGWDGRSFASELRSGRVRGRDHLVITQGAWTCQRGVRWDDYLALHTLHDGYHGWPEWMLFDVARDPHETRDLAVAHPELVQHAGGLLDRWRSAAVAGNPSRVDPIDTVLVEGGPAHVRGQLAKYLERLRATGRADWAERLERAHPAEP